MKLLLKVATIFLLPPTLFFLWSGCLFPTTGAWQCISIVECQREKTSKGEKANEPAKNASSGVPVWLKAAGFLLPAFAC